MDLKNHKLLGIVALLIAACVAFAVYTGFARADDAKKAEAQPRRDPNTVELTQDQASHIPVVQVGNHQFVVATDAVGAIDFDQDKLSMVSSPYAGRIDRVLVKAGDSVFKGQVLFTIESPDLVQAESTLVSAAGAQMVTKNALSRARELVDTHGLAQKDYEQAQADAQTADAALRAARDALHIFGRDDHAIDQIVTSGKVDAQMEIRSPIAGLVTARNAAPGTLVQPGNTPYPIIVADTTTKWMLANVSESDLPGIAVGQSIEVRVDAYPAKTFVGKVENISAALDANSHRAVIRTSIRDPQNELKPQMFATFRIIKSRPAPTLAVPVGGVVREGDGTHTVWVTTDRRVFKLRLVEVGLVQDGLQQILSGVAGGETVASDGALFLSNARVLSEQ
jgi:cobalt-zinc-cadmium efflux system membrane fusion protein